ncbi:SDR family oxidoreductase [Natronobiforma cellulositropha]|uniref:SDR family oxidoreductase n=1 Tax=Natronobiforma cellulositropha TaxID=1679076 RepID=UPI0021D6101B|nr:SDR family oxidoreductase [Natronobiforma cellulositropha]
MTSPTVLVTGCATGIGNETARAFAERDWTVYATDPDEDALEDLARAGCETATLDVREGDDASRVVERIEDEQGRLDCLVNNAGYGQVGPVEEIPTDQVEAQFQVNFFGQHRLLRAVLPVMREQGYGRLINVSSVYGRTVFPGQGIYAASKYAVEAMSDTLRAEVGAFDIDVVLIEPGPVETNFGERAQAQLAELEPTGAYEWIHDLYDPDVFGRRFVDRGPGYVQPEEVATAIVEAAYARAPADRIPVGPWKYRLWLEEITPAPVRDRLNRLVRHVPSSLA